MLRDKILSFVNV